MTLPAWLNLVKQGPAFARHIWLGGAVLLLLLLALLRITHDPLSRADAYGAMLAESIAELAVVPLVKQDRIELGLLSNRMAQLPAVTGVTVIGVDDQVLSVTRPNAPGSTYRYPIRIDDAVIGYVQVAIDPAAVAPIPRWPWLVTLLALGIMPWLLSGLSWLLTRAEQWQLARQERALEPLTGLPAADAGNADEYLIVVCLLNQLGLSAPDQQQLVAGATSAAAYVAELYNGRIESQPGNALAIWFSNSQGSEMPFDVVCASSLLARYLASSGDQGKFKLGLHHRCPVITEDGELLPSVNRATVLADAVLLAAAAGEGQVVVSDIAMNSFNNPERMVIEPFDHPLGSDLSSAGEQSHRLHDLAPSYAILVTSQLETLLAHNGSTDSESTF